VRISSSAREVHGGHAAAPELTLDGVAVLEDGAEGAEGLAQVECREGTSVG